MKYLYSVTFALFFGSVLAYSHCEIPCGIYDDKLRIKLLKEHAATIEKSTRKILALEKAEKVNNNQLVRWIFNKEEHAEKIQDIVWQYFMTQRIKPPEEKKKTAVSAYNSQLALLHEILITSMRAKQHTDLSQANAILKAVEAFEKAYFLKNSE